LTLAFCVYFPVDLEVFFT